MEKPKSEFEQRTLDIRRVVRVVAGGRRFSFRITVALGDRKGRVGVGTAKGQDVAMSIEKAMRQAKKRMIKINVEGGTIPHEIEMKVKSARILLKPAKAGTGVIAGGAVRVICDLAGIKNIVGKIVGKSSNKINIAEATIEALRVMRPRKEKAPVQAVPAAPVVQAA